MKIIVGRSGLSLMAGDGLAIPTKCGAALTLLVHMGAKMTSRDKIWFRDESQTRASRSVQAGAFKRMVIIIIKHGSPRVGGIPGVVFCVKMENRQKACACIYA